MVKRCDAAGCAAYGAGSHRQGAASRAAQSLVRANSMLSLADMRLRRVQRQCDETRARVAFSRSPNGWTCEMFENRQRAWSQTLGWFALPLAIRLRLAADPSYLAIRPSSSTAPRKILRYSRVPRNGQEHVRERIDEA